MTLPELPLLPTTVIGSHGQPGWMWLTREAMAQGRLGPVDRHEAWEDATRLAMADMVDAGVDVIATGEMGRSQFIVGFYERLRGIRNLEQPRRLGVPHWDTNVPMEVVDRISAPGGLGVVEEFRMARRFTNRPMKATVPGPFTLVIPLKGGGPLPWWPAPRSSARNWAPADPPKCIMSGEEEIMALCRQART